MFEFIKKLFDSNEKQLQKEQPIVDEINALEDQFQALTNEELKAKTKQFRKTLNIDLEKARKGPQFTVDSNHARKEEINTEREKLKEIMPEAFATVREASRRVAQHRHYDVQLLAGVFLFRNNLTELFTGEGKTLAANLPLYLYALTGRGAHLVTVNDYLARRDAEWVGHIFHSLGITVGAINNETQYRFVPDEEAIELKGDEAKKLIKERDEKKKKTGRMNYDHMSGVNLLECTKQEAYACDVVYGTSNEFGFDYLRDNMAHKLEDVVQGPLYYVIVDEADSILIDEARTPLIISQKASASGDLYNKFASVVQEIQEETHYTVDEKSKAVVLNDQGIEKVEKILGVKNIYSNSTYAYHLENALKAKELYHLDDEYLIRDGKVYIVDAFTGRVLEGRRYSEGLHQAIEAKEGVPVQSESKTVATITLQNFFRLYDNLAGMTATALTEAEEFAETYGLDVVVIPTHEPMIRDDKPDVVYKSQAAKFRAIVQDVMKRHKVGQPVLLGTTSVEKSELFDEALSKEGIEHNVLNAKLNEQESKIVAKAGQKDQVTIATNMAGRGTDIALGEGVRELGGLYVIGSERHEARRIDNQLRGRSGRQGDPGESRFYVSFEDDLMRIFGGGQMQAILGRVGMDEDMPISARLLGRTIESAQKKVESYHYDIRKHLVEYDDILNQQREIIYALRRKILQLVKKQEGNTKTNIGTDKSSDNNISADKDKDKAERVAEKKRALQKNLQDVDIQNIMDVLQGFSFIHTDTHQLVINKLSEYPLLNSALTVVVLKKVMMHVEFILSAQLVGDMEIDNKEERKTVAQIKSLLTEDLTEVTVKLLGYKDSTEFFREFDKLEKISQQSDILLKLVFVAFLFHINVVGENVVEELIKMLFLQSIDRFWMEHLSTMTNLKQGISLRNIARRDPLVEYKNEGFELFEQMLHSIDESVVTRFFKIRVVQKKSYASDKSTEATGVEQKQEAKSAYELNKVGDPQSQKTVKKMLGQMEGSAKVSGGNGISLITEHSTKVENLETSSGGDSTSNKMIKRTHKKVGRNDPCPCGSGKKYKKCCYPKFEK